jgi:peptidoglycan/xylan/chitin deacetylase (PgdA/CDA1 family)
VRRFVTVAVVIAVALWVAACGIGLRTPSNTEPAVEAVTATPATAPVPTDPYVQPRPEPAIPPVSTEPLFLAPGQTVVSISFDDAHASQAEAARMMSENGLAGTFYINSGRVGMPDYLTLADLDSIAMSGHEIGGHSLTHPAMADVNHDEVRREICDDRTALLGWGFPVRSFAFPFGPATPQDSAAARECGYNSARALGDLRSVNSCESCALTEDVPPANPMRTRASDQVESTWSAADIEQLIIDARTVGGWLQLTFHGLCTTDCSQISTPQAQFQELVSWLADQQAQGLVLVRPVGDIIGGPVLPAVVGPAVPPVAPWSNGVVNPGLEDAVDGVPRCWMRGGFGNNRPEFSLVPTGPGGTTASRLDMRDYVDGDAKLLPTTDLGTCAPSVSPGSTYTIQARYTSTVPTSFAVQYRLARGIWVFGVSSPEFPPAAEFTTARWTLPPIPEGVTAVSFGLSLTQNGELVTDDYSLTPDVGTPP